MKALCFPNPKREPGTRRKCSSLLTLPVKMVPKQRYAIRTAESIQRWRVLRMKRLIPVVMIDGTTIFHRFRKISTRKPCPSLVAGCWIILCFVSPVFPAEAVPPAQVNAFLHTYCVRCHSPEEQ